MLRVAAALLAAFMMFTSTSQGQATQPESPPPDRVLSWIKTYRTKPDYKLLPDAVEALAVGGAFQEPDAAGVFVGFIAGVIGSNPDHAEKLVFKMLAVVKPEDNWAVVRAAAYSGLPDWRNLLRKVGEKAPNRRTMIDAYISGRLPTLTDFAIRERKGMWGRMFSSDSEDKLVLEPSPVVMDTFWGDVDRRSRPQQHEPRGSEPRHAK